MTVEQKQAAVRDYLEGRDTYQQVASRHECSAGSLRKWCLKVRKGEELRGRGGAQQHNHGHTPEEAVWFAKFKNQGWSMQEIADKLDRSVQTTYLIQKEARQRGLIDEEKVRKRGERKDRD